MPECEANGSTEPLDTLSEPQGISLILTTKPQQGRRKEILQVLMIHCACSASRP